MAAGEGKRLAPITETRPKPLIHIAGKPLIQHTMEILRDNGIQEVLLVVGYLKEQIMNYFGDGSKLKLKISYIEQTEFLGTAHATNLAKKFVGNDPFFLIYGDLFLDAEIIHQAIDAFKNSAFTGLITAIKVEDPTKFGILKVSKEKHLEQIVEKPADSRYGTLANAGVYIFTPEIFVGIQETQKSPRGEYELTESIERGIKKEKKYHVIDISNYFWSDVGHAWQFLEANRYVLSKIAKGHNCEEAGVIPTQVPAEIINNGGFIEKGATIHGYLLLGKNSVIKAGTYIEGPVLIGEDSSIGPNSYIRPFSSIGNGVKIGNATEIKASIIMDHTSIAHLSYIGDSILGSHVNIGCGTITANVRLDKTEIFMEIKGSPVNTFRKKLGTVIGDNASLGIQVSIMPGKTIGSYAQIGANTVITKNIGKNSLYYVEQQHDLKSKTNDE